MKFDPSSISPRTIGRLLMHLTPQMRDRPSFFAVWRSGDTTDLTRMLSHMVLAAFDPIGQWVLVRADDSPIYAEVAELLQRSENGENIDDERIARLAWRMPVIFGVDVKNPLALAATLASMRVDVMKALPGAVTWDPLEKPYKGVSIVRIQATPTGAREYLGFDKSPKREPFLPAIYYATIDGAFYLTLNETMLHDFIDRAKDKRESKRKMIEVNSSLYVAPGAAKLARGFVHMFLEKQIHEQALAGAPLWYPLYRAGLIVEGTDAAAVRELAERYYGFVPVSPDGAGYVYDRRLDEVRNERHGSPARPKMHRTLAENAPIRKLLEQMRTIRADLRFREDGIHTTLTMDR